MNFLTLQLLDMSLMSTVGEIGEPDPRRIP